MPKFPLEIPGGQTVEAQDFTDGLDRILLIGERMFRIRPVSDGEYYTMVKVRGTKRSIKGDLVAVWNAVARIYDVYRRYDSRVRKAKEDAQNAREAELHKIAEEMSSP